MKWRYAMRMGRGELKQVQDNILLSGDA